MRCILLINRLRLSRVLMAAPILMLLLAGQASNSPVSPSAPDLRWTENGGAITFTLRFDHPSALQATDQHVEMGYYYLDCAHEDGPPAQADWAFNSPLVNHVRRVYYPDQKVLRFIFYVPRGSNVRIDRTTPDAKNCVLAILPMVAATLSSAMPMPPAPAGAAKPATATRKLVVIDPGHGGMPADPTVSIGARSSGRFSSHRYYEKDIVLLIGQYLEEYIKQTPNMEAFMTRRADVYVSLEDRIKLANQAHGDLFLSIHLNATDAHTRSPRGFEIYYLTDETRAVNHQLAAMENDEKQLLDTKDSSGQTLGQLLRILANEKFPQVQAESRDLCNVIDEEFVKGGPFRHFNRGVKADAFRVLLNFNMPAALAECGFIDNDDDAKLLTTPAGQKQIAALLFNGINRYFAVVDPKFQPHMAKVDP